MWCDEGQISIQGEGLCAEGEILPFLYQKLHLWRGGGCGGYRVRGGWMRDWERGGGMMVDCRSRVSEW